MIVIPMAFPGGAGGQNGAGETNFRMEGIAMFPIFFIGDRRDHRIPQAFAAAAEPHFLCGLINQELARWNPAADFLAVELESTKKIQGGGAVIFKDRLELPQKHFSCENVCVINSQDGKAAEFAARHGLMTVACGPSPYDTLTFSSLTAEKAVVSLQRQLLLPGEGGYIEPAEYTITLKSKPELYTILAVASVFLLSGHGDSLSDITI